VIPTTTIPTTTIATTTAAGSYFLIAFIFVFWRAIASFAFSIFGGHRSYVCNLFVVGFGSYRWLRYINTHDTQAEAGRKSIAALPAQEKNEQT